MAPRFEDLLEAAPDAMIITDHGGQILAVNTQVERLFGYTRDELCGCSVDALLPDRLRESHSAHRSRYVADPKTRPMGVARELAGRRKDGSEFPVEISLSPIAVDGGGVVAAVRDVSERKLLEARLVASDRLAALGTLAAGIAHEINNPLTYVALNVDLALEELGSMAAVSQSARLQELELLLMASRDGAERVRRIVAALKRFSRASDEPRVPTDVQGVLELAIRMSINEVRYRAQLVKDYANVPRVHADESRLGQVFVNLLVNAAQAIPDGHPEENEIRVATRTDAEGNAVVEVRDTGAGIPPDVLSRIYDPFFTTKPVGVGTGLGLFISQGIVMSLGGRIEIESTPGAGTVARVVLPAAKEAELDAGGPVSTSRAEPQVRGRILVVDDEPLVARSIRLVLSDHDVTVVTGARAALALLGDGESFDVILCDIMMAEMTGMDFHAALCTSHPELVSRVVFMSGGAFTVAAQKFLDAVTNERLEKPFAPGALRRLVRRRLGAG